MKLLVNIASILSLLESIMRQPVTPTALQPIPIHIVNACFPQEWHFENARSILKAILGNNPISSNIVNKGKNIIIGGNITLTTHAVVLYIPYTIIFSKLKGKNFNKLYIGSSNLNNKLDNNSDG